jgi:hypothetical protein
VEVPEEQLLMQETEETEENMEQVVVVAEVL